MCHDKAVPSEYCGVTDRLASTHSVAGSNQKPLLDSRDVTWVVRVHLRPSLTNSYTLVPLLIDCSVRRR